jgi:hypothetical protein
LLAWEIVMENAAPVGFDRMREMEGRQVRLAFDDGHVVEARLMSASRDADGSLHLVYDHVEQATHPHPYTFQPDDTYYSEGERLVGLEPLG